MEILNENNFITFQSEDDNGVFEVSLTKDSLPQLTLRSNIDEFPDEAYVNLSGVELIAIRNMFNIVIKINKWEE